MGCWLNGQKRVPQALYYMASAVVVTTAANEQNCKYSMISSLACRHLLDDPRSSIDEPRVEHERKPELSAKLTSRRLLVSPCAYPLRPPSRYHIRNNSTFKDPSQGSGHRTRLFKLSRSDRSSHRHGQSTPATPCANLYAAPSAEQHPPRHILRPFPIFLRSFRGWRFHTIAAEDVAWCWYVGSTPLPPIPSLTHENDAD